MSLMHSKPPAAEHGRMLITDPPGIDPSQLRDRMEGRVSAPGDPDWDEARQAWNLAVDQRPAAVAIPETTDDVVAVVEFARERGLLVTAQGTGHNAGAYDTLANTILVKTHELRGVEIDVDERIARCAAGTLWIEVTQPASDARPRPARRLLPDVGVVGYVLGGGLSWLARKHGLAANNVRRHRARDRRRRDSSAPTHDDHADLFWALRGGGGNYGIVTAVEIELYEYATVYAGMLMWPWDRAAEILKAWVAWTKTAPEEFTTSARMLQIPPLPDLPEFLRGKAFVAIDGAYLGDDAAGAEVLAAAARARPGDGLVRPDGAGRPLLRPHGSRGPDPRHRRAHDARRARRRRHRRARRDRRPGLRLAARRRRAAPPRRRALALRRAPRRGRRHAAAPTPCSPSACR